MEAQDLAAQERLGEISRVLVGARQAAKALPGFPGALPQTFGEAYSIQELSRGLWQDDVVGWKVGGVPPAFIDRFGETRLVGPIFSRSVQTVDDAGHVEMPVFMDGFAAIEPELIVQLGATRADDRMFIGAEIASSPLPSINAIGPIAVISDFGNNNGMVIGPEIVAWRGQDLGSIPVICMIDDQCVGEREVSNAMVSADQTIAFLLSHGERKGIKMPPGTYISTGAITGVHEAEIGARSRISFGDHGAFALSLIAAEPIL